MLALIGSTDGDRRFSALGRVFALSALVWAWRRAAGNERERIAWFTFSMGTFWVTDLLISIVFTFGLQVPHLNLIWSRCASRLSSATTRLWPTPRCACAWS